MQGPDTDAQDQPPPFTQIRLATHGRSIQMGHLQTSRGLPCQVRSAPESRHRCSRPTSRLRAVCRRASQRRHLRFTLDACVREVPAHLKACSCLWNSTDRGTKATAAIFMREAAVRQSNDNGACSGWPKVLGPAVQNERAQIAKGGGLHLVRTRPRAPFDGDLMRLVVGGRDTPEQRFRYAKPYRH
jgi:hypothetical protein